MKNDVPSNLVYSVTASDGTEYTGSICKAWGIFDTYYGGMGIKIAKFTVIGGLNAIVKGVFIAMSNRAGFHF